MFPVASRSLHPAFLNRPLNKALARLPLLSSSSGDELQPFDGRLRHVRSVVPQSSAKITASFFPCRRCSMPKANRLNMPCYSCLWICDILIQGVG